MEDIFIQHIKVNKARNLVDFDIPLSPNERKHLLITGKNGSGKTSLLLELRTFFYEVITFVIINRHIQSYETSKTRLLNLQIQKDRLLESPIEKKDQMTQLSKQIEETQNLLRRFGGTEITLKSHFLLDEYFKKGDFIIALFEAKRNAELKTPKGINKVDLKSTYNVGENAGDQFIQYIVNLRADRSFARDDNDTTTVEKINEWFDQFEENLFKLFDSPGMQLQFDRSTYNFNIIEGGKEPYNFNQLSGGYSAIINIVTELIMRMEKHHSKNYDIQGVVLIDEIETHLHIELQKKILPFLTAFFPKIQFIVTTHSPFVLSSIENAVICDLEKRIVTTDLSGYSYDTLVESYFDSDKYSSILKEYIKEYEELLDKENLSQDEKNRLFQLKRYVNDVPKFMSDELAVKVQQLRLKELSKKAKNGLPA